MWCCASCPALPSWSCWQLWTTFHTLTPTCTLNASRHTAHCSHGVRSLCACTTWCVPAAGKAEPEVSVADMLGPRYRRGVIIGIILFAIQ